MNRNQVKGGMKEAGGKMQDDARKAREEDRRP